MSNENAYNIDNEESFNDLLSCIKDGSFIFKDKQDNIIKGTLDGNPIAFLVEPQYINAIPVEKYDRLIYGKDQTENIVSVEVVDGKLIKFIEKNGQVSETVSDYKYWFITENCLNRSKQTQLSGSQPFKWVMEYNDYQEWSRAKAGLYNRQAFYCVNNLKEQAMIRQGITYFKGMKLSDVSVLSFDIEASGLKQNKDSVAYCITNTFRNANGIIRRHFYLDDYNDDDKAMINDWCEWVREINPSVVIGHNIYSYDLPYLDFVSKAGLALGRDGSDITFSKKARQKRKDGSQSYDYFEAKIFGREIIDTMFLAITYDIGRKYESYGLKSIVRQEGLEKPDRTFVDPSKIRQYYEERHINPEMWSNVKTYAAEDSDDSLKLYDLMMPSFFYFTQSVGKSFQEMILSATGSQINNMMVRSYLQEGGSVAKADETSSFEGALSYGIPGVYRNCVKYDISSLYPSVMRQYRIYHPQKDPEAKFLRMLETFTLDRLKFKKLAKETGDRSFDDLQGSKKIAINSMYGFMGASGLNYNYIKGASDTTMYGREILKQAIIFATGKPYEYWKPVEETEEQDEEN